MYGLLTHIVSSRQRKQTHADSRQRLQHPIVQIAAGNIMRIGDEVVLLGFQGSERVSANEWANLLGTIGYEVTCGISARVPRIYLR